MQNNSDPFAVQAKQNKLYLTIGGALLVVALLLGLLGAGVLGLGSKLGGSVTKSTHTSGPVTPAGGDLPPAITASGLENIPVTVNEEEVKQMPPHILDWLKHLERCEKRKVDLTRKELASAGALVQFGSIGNIKPGDFNDPEGALDKMPGQSELKATEEFSPGWDELIEFFDSKPAPNECIAARNAYDQHLSEIKWHVDQIRTVFSSLGGDMENVSKMQEKIEELMKMSETHKGAVDVAGNDTDRQVQLICDKYGVRKWFKIEGNVGGGLEGVFGAFKGMIGR